MHIVPARILDDCSFEDAGDVVPRPGAVLNGTAGLTPLEGDTVPSLEFGEHEERDGIKTRGKHDAWRATGAGVNGMPKGWKHRRL